MLRGGSHPDPWSLSKGVSDQPSSFGNARKVGVTLAVNVGKNNLKDVQKDLGMMEGFDVGLETGVKYRLHHALRPRLPLLPRVLMLKLTPT